MPRLLGTNIIIVLKNKRQLADIIAATTQRDFRLS